MEIDDLFDFNSDFLDQESSQIGNYFHLSMNSFLKSSLFKMKLKMSTKVRIL